MDEEKIDFKEEALETAEKFLKEWETGKPVRMAKYIQKSWLMGRAMKWKKIIRQILTVDEVLGWKIRKTVRVGELCYDVFFEAKVRQDGKDRIINGLMRIIKENAIGIPDKNGKWGVNPHSLLRSTIVDVKE